MTELSSRQILTNLPKQSKVNEMIEKGELIVSLPELPQRKNRLSRQKNVDMLKEQLLSYWGLKK